MRSLAALLLEESEHHRLAAEGIEAALPLPAAALAADRGTGLTPIPADRETPSRAAGAVSTVAAAALADRQRQQRPNPGLPGPLPRALRPVRLAMSPIPSRTRRSRSGTGSISLSAAVARPLVSPVARRAEGSALRSGSSRPCRATPRDGLASVRAAARSSAAAPMVPRQAPLVPLALPSARPASRLRLVHSQSVAATLPTSPPRPIVARLSADRRSLLQDLVERSDIRVASVRADGLCPGSLHEARGPFSGSAECTDQ
jgi:hypothetical protein